jgi:hypothetical protein
MTLDQSLILMEIFQITKEQREVIMAVGGFSSLLEELGKLMDIKDLAPDPNNACLISFDNGLKIQVEPDARDQYIMVICPLGTVTAGQYRENLLVAAMKMNHMPYPRAGTFAYNSENDMLIIFERFEFSLVKAVDLAAAIGRMSDVALKWKEALQRGDVPYIQESYDSGSGGSGVFDLI